MKITKSILKIKFTKLLPSISILILSAIQLSCGKLNIRSKYNYNDIKNKKVCIHMNIMHRTDKIFLRKLLEEPNITRTGDCEYYLITVLHGTESTLSDIKGIRVENIVNMEVKYSLYKNDKTKAKQIQQVLNSPAIYSSLQYTGQLNSSMSKNAGNITNEQSEKNSEIRNINQVYIGTKIRLDELLKNINNSSYHEQKPFLINNALLTNVNQSREDAEKQLASLLADKVANDIMLEIIRFEQNETKKNHN